MVVGIINPNTRLASIRTQNRLDPECKNIDHSLKSMKTPDFYLSHPATKRPPPLSLSLSIYLYIYIYISYFPPSEDGVHKISLGYVLKLSYVYQYLFIT
jgi:hypothetical protein